MRALIALMLMLFVAGCGGSDLGVSDAWARSTPAVADAAAIYLTLANDSTREEAVVGVRSDRCASMEIHETVLEDDVMEMTRVEALALPPDRAVQMEPGGLHVMCLGVREPLTEGDSFTVEVELGTGSSLTFEVSVEDR